jgi:hypothetical protein
LHQLRSASPSYHLRRYVRAYAQRDVYGEPDPIVQPVPASLEHILEFEFKRPPEIEFQDGRHIIAYQTALVGPHTVPNARVFLAGAVQSFAIFFEPFGLWQLFRIPNGELTDRFYCASDLLGPRIKQLWLILGRLQNVRTASCVGREISLGSGIATVRADAHHESCCSLV